MADYYTANVALGLCMRIALKVKQDLPQLEPDISLQDVSESRGEFLTYFRNIQQSDRLAASRLELMLSQYEPDKMALEVFAEFQVDESDNPEPSAFSADAIIKICERLNPIVTESLVHRSPDPYLEPGVTKGIVSRSLKVRFRVYEKQYERDQEDYTFDIDEVEIADAAIPYVKSLNEIRERLSPFRRTP